MFLLLSMSGFDIGIILDSLNELEYSRSVFPGTALELCVRSGIFIVEWLSAFITLS